MQLSLNKARVYIEKELGGFLVGSRAWGGSTSKSDYDYVISKPQLDNIKDFLKRFGIIPSEGAPYMDNTSMYFEVQDNCNSAKVNIIALSKRIRKCWEEASKMMHAAPDSILKNREVRRYTFTMLVDMLAHFVHKKED